MHAHARRARARMRSIRSQNCRRDSGSTPVVGSSRISRSGSWISAQQRPSFWRMPPESLLGRAVGERREARARRAARDAPLALAAALAEQAAEELDVLAHAEVGIEVLAEPLRHVGDARADRARGGARRRCRRRAPRRAPSWMLPGAGDRGRAASICRRRRGRSARPCSRPGMSSVTSSSASVVAVAMRDAVEARDRRSPARHSDATRLQRWLASRPSGRVRT